MKTEHLLIIRFSALGDVAMAVPVVASLARQYPHLRITMLSQPFARPLFEGLADNVSFMEADIRGEYHGMKGLNALYRRLAAKHFTAVADFHNILRSNYLRMRFNIDRYHVAHIDKHRSLRRQLVCHGAATAQPLPSSFQSYADVLARLGYPVTLDFTSIFPGGAAPLRQLPEAIGEKRALQQWIGIAPFAAHPGKIYPTERMEQVVAQLERLHPSCRIFLFGAGDKEKATLDAWTRRHRCATSVPGTLSGLAQELALMSRLDVMISMDSANMHLASIAGTRVVSIWGATHPKAGFLGWHQREDDAVQTTLPCRPCSIFGQKPCQRGDWACMQQITPEQIVEKVERVLAEKR